MKLEATTISQVGDYSSATLKELLAKEFSRLAPQLRNRFDLAVPITDVGLDSIGLTQIIFAIEDAFNVELDETLIAELTGLETIGDFYSAVDRYLKDGVPPLCRPG